MVDDARIGDFSQSPVGPPRSPTKDALDSAEKRLDLESKEDEATLKPMLSYEDRLRAVGVTREQAADIIDAVLLKGHWSEVISITKRVQARFRTRGARDTRRAQELIEQQRLTYDRHYNELMSRYLLAASLEAFGEDKLEHAPRKAVADLVEKAYDSRLSYVEGLADPVLRILFNKLFEFDKKVAAVLEEGSIENF